MVMQKNVNTLKYISLVTLTVQNALLGLCMRHARTRAVDTFLSSTAVFMSEVVKLVICLFLVYNEEDRHFKKCLKVLHKTIIGSALDTLRVCVPSLIYIIQNNLLYLSASHLDAATYQVTYQMKILTTALFAVVILKRKLFKTQWSSLILLMIGVVLVQLAQSDKTNRLSPEFPEQNRIVGLCAALGACFLSGFAGIYFEKILKGANISVWMRNVQLSLLSLPFGALTCAINDGYSISTNGFFFGYDFFVWFLILLQACGGLIVAAVVKYADNILKGFATSLAIIISCIASIYLLNFQLTLQFTFGALFVIISIFLYGYDPNNGKLLQNSFEEEKLMSRV